MKATMRTLLLIVTVFLLMSSVGVYASSVAETGPVPIESPSSEPLTIGFDLSGGAVNAVTVTWTPIGLGDFKIEAMSANVYGMVIMAVTSMDRRTDIIPIDSIEAKDLETIEVAIAEL